MTDIDWDIVPDNEPEETYVERLTGLREIFPEVTFNAEKNLILMLENRFNKIVDKFSFLNKLVA